MIRLIIFIMILFEFIYIYIYLFIYLRKSLSHSIEYKSHDGSAILVEQPSALRNDANLNDIIKGSYFI